MAAVTAPLIEHVPAHRPASVSVVITADTLDQWDDIDQALTALRRQTRRPEQVLLVVDHHDQLLEWAADAWAAPEGPGLRVEVVANTGPRGLAGARNTGVAFSWGDVVAFLDHPAETTDRHWIETMLEDYADPDVAGVGGGAVADWGGLGAPAWLPDEYGWAVGCLHAGLPVDVGDVDAVTDGNMSFRRDVLEAIGGFRAVLRSSDDLCVRMRRRFPLARLLHDPDLAVHHRMSDDARSFGHYRRRCFEEGWVAASLARSAGDRGVAPARPFTPVASRGVIEGVREGFRGELEGFQRAGALLVGASWAAAGYVRARVAGKI